MSTTANQMGGGKSILRRLEPLPNVGGAAAGTCANVTTQSSGSTPVPHLSMPVIRTSKHWVLPPRPKPGRKPNKTDMHVKIQKIKDENMRLKKELSKLVLDLKSLKQSSGDSSPSGTGVGEKRARPLMDDVVVEYLNFD